MLEKEKAIDAVLIATPDHLHAYVSILAMKAGKHVYCEKPLTHNIWEARLVAQVAKETGVATQMGNQGRSSEGHRQTAEWIWDGAIGAVREVHAWGGSSPFASGRGRPAGTPEVPAGFNWDLWLGPARGRVRTTPPTRRSAGAATGPSGAGRCPTSRSTTSTRRSTRSPSTPRRPSRPRPSGGVDSEVVAFGMLVTWRFGERSTGTGRWRR